MIIDEDNKDFFLQAMRVDFLTEKWEMELYVNALLKAAEWGKKVDEQNREYFSKNHLIDKYNV